MGIEPETLGPPEKKLSSSAAGRKQLQISDTMGLTVTFLRAVFLLGAEVTVLPAWSSSQEVPLGLGGAANHPTSWKGGRQGPSSSISHPELMHACHTSQVWTTRGH